MADIAFGPNGRAYFPTKYHGEVSLSKKKWKIICGEPERFYYRYNAEKVATTLINPDLVRYHRLIKDQFIYYKKFDLYKLDEQSEGPVMCKYFAAIMDQGTKRICTVYPLVRPKEGKEYKGGDPV